jgi:hypothetical protein
MSKNKACKDGERSVRTAFSMGSLQKEFLSAYKEAYKDTVVILKDSRKILEKKAKNK